MPEGDYLYPEAHEAIAGSAMSRAYWLTQCAYAAKYEAVHGKPPGMTEQMLEQRAAVLNVAHDIFKVSARRAMSESMANWKAAEALARA